ncbi:MAG TPA: phosphatase PAP2 family protein [Longimicrobiaceae bacterium]|nr:phosphatase PAP2 family protein [Longimicrobiaceae bacterium]
MDGLWNFLFGPAPIRWIQEFFGLGHPLPFRAFSLIGDTWGIILVIGVAFWLFGRRTAYATIGIVLLGAATKVLLSNIFQQSRPSEAAVVVYQHLQIGSFPSGHVYETVGPWGLLFALGCVPFWVPVIATLLVGVGRLYLGAHFLGDVLGGIFFGVLLVGIYHMAWPHFYSWVKRRGPRFFLVSGVVILACVAVSIVVAADPNPRRFEILGLVAGGSLALIMERRLVGGSPPVSIVAAVVRVLVGAAGIFAFLLLDRFADPDAAFLGIFTAGAATMWAILASKMYGAGPPWQEPGSLRDVSE